VLKTDQMHQNAARVSARKPRRWLKWTSLLLLAIVASVSVGCGKPITPYWPDLAVVGDTVYVAETNGQVFALSAETGDIIWRYPLTQQKGGSLLSGCSQTTLSDGPFYSAPAVNDEFVFLGSAGEQTRSLFSKGENLSGLRALDHTGDVQWEFRGTEDRTVASPLLTDDTVYLASSDHNVYAIDLETRDTRWTFGTENWVWATPVTDGNTLFVSSMDHRLYAVDAQTGQERWRFAESTSALPASPALVEGTLSVGSLDGHIYAVEGNSGSLLWEAQLAGGIWGTPAIEGDTLFVGTLEGQVYALSTADGSEIWHSEADGEIRGSLAFEDGTVYCGSADGQLYAFDAQTGAQTASPLGQQIDNAAIHTAPVYDGKQLYIVATDGQVFALDLEHKAIVWKTNPLDQD